MKFVAVLAWLSTVSFLILQLSHVILWSWWLVFLPLLAYYGFVILVLALAAAVIYNKVGNERFKRLLDDGGSDESNRVSRM